MTPMDFYLWEKLEQQVYSADNKRKHEQRIRRVYIAIDLNEIHHAVLSVLTRFRKYIVQSHHFEHLQCNSKYANK